MISALAPNPAAPDRRIRMLAVACLACVVEIALGALDVRRAGSMVLASDVVLLAILFWPVFGVTLARLHAPRPLYSLGLPLHIAALVSLMLAGFDRPFAAPSIPGVVPGLLIALLIGWLAGEVTQGATQRDVVAPTGVAVAA